MHEISNRLYWYVRIDLIERSIKMLTDGGMPLQEAIDIVQPYFKNIEIKG